MAGSAGALKPGQPGRASVQRRLDQTVTRVLVILTSSVSSTNVDRTKSPSLLRNIRPFIPFSIATWKFLCNDPSSFQYVDFRTDYDRGPKTLLRTLGVEQQAVAAAVLEFPPSRKTPQPM